MTRADTAAKQQSFAVTGPADGAVCRLFHKYLSLASGWGFRLLQTDPVAAPAWLRVLL